jgi:hypothetical protein
VVGLAVFTQYWYWYPLSHFLSLAFQPTAVVGVNADLKMPQLQLVSNCKPSTFAYAAALTQETTQQVCPLEPHRHSSSSTRGEHALSASSGRAWARWVSQDAATREPAL